MCEDGLREGAFWHAAKRSFGEMRSQAGARDRDPNTATLSPGSLQRMVRLHGLFAFR
jgi:hypothetical protein